MSAEEPVDGAALLAGLGDQFELREESTQIVLAPALLDRWEELQGVVEAAYEEDRKSPRMAKGKESAKTKRLVKELEEFEAGPLSAAAVTFRFRAMSKDAYRALCAEHPPRKGDQLDAYVGFDREAVDNAMIRACLYDPVFVDCTKKGCTHDACGTWQQLVAKINPSEWAELEKTVQAANRAVTQAPKSLLPSAIRRLSGSASESPNASE